MKAEDFDRGGCSKTENYNNQGSVNKVRNVHGNMLTVTSYHSFVQSSSPVVPNGINFGPKKPEDNFTGRSTELEKLEEVSSSTNAEIVVVSGMGGVGKTQLLRKFIEVNRTKYRNVIWIDSDEEEIVRTTFRTLASDHLNISTINANGEEKDSTSVIEQVLSSLCKQKTLFVYDNVDLNETLRFILAIAPSVGENPHVFITSRLQKWRPGITVLRLHVWTRTESTDYISKTLDNRSIDSADDRELLAKKLQNFPLALRQATAHINQIKWKDFKISHYLKEFASKTSEMLNSTAFEEISTCRYQRTTLTTWCITMDTIKKNGRNGQLAIKILNIVAFFDPENIDTKNFFHLICDESDENLPTAERIHLAIDLLIKYCMVDSSDCQRWLSIHRLVQEVIKLKLKESSEEESTLRDALIVFSKTVNEFRSGPHFILVFESALTFPNLVREFASLLVDLLQETLIYRPSFARTSGATVIERVSKALGQNHRVALNICFHVAISYMELEMLAEASKQCREIVEEQKTLFGQQRVDILKTQNELILWFHQQGEQDLARQLLKTILMELQQTLLSSDDPDILKLLMRFTESRRRRRT